MLTLNFKLVGIRDRQWWVIKYDEIIDGKTQDLSNPNKVNILLSKDYEDPIKLEWANPSLRESLEPPTLYLDTNIMKSKEDFIHSIKNILCNIKCKYIPDKYDNVEFKYLDKMYEKVTRGFWKKDLIEKHNEFGKNSLEDLDSLMNPHEGYNVITMVNRDGESPKILCRFPDSRLVVFKDPLFLNTDVKNKGINGAKVGFILGFIDSISPEVNLNYMDVIPLFVIEMDIYKKYNYYTSSHIDNIHSTGKLNRDWKAKLKHIVAKALNDKNIDIKFTNNQKDFWIMNHSIDFGRGSKKVSILCEKANFSNPHKFRFSVSKLGESKEFILDPKNNRGTEKYPNTLSEFFSYVCSIIEYNEDYTTFLDYFQVFIGEHWTSDLGIDISKNISKFYPVNRGGNVMLNNGYILDKFKFVK